MLSVEDTIRSVKNDGRDPPPPPSIGDADLSPMREGENGTGVDLFSRPLERHAKLFARGNLMSFWIGVRSVGWISSAFTAQGLGGAGLSWAERSCFVWTGTGGLSKGFPPPGVIISNVGRACVGGTTVHGKKYVLNKTIDVSLSVRYTVIIRCGMLNSLLLFTDSSFNAWIDSGIRLPLLYTHILLDLCGAGECRLRLL